VRASATPPAGSQAGPRAVVLVTGSELVRGDRRDANGPYLARELSHLGLEPARIVLVGDRPELLAAALAEAVEADVCLVSGGLGPTHDDRTIELLARATGRALAVDPELEREIERLGREIAARLGRPYADFEAGVRKQAMLPAGGVALGIAGTAPAVLLEHDGRVAVALPGPPGELRRLWPNALAHPAFERVVARARPRLHRTIRFFGPAEAAVAAALAQSGEAEDGLEVTVCARGLEIHVDLFAEPEAEERAAALARSLRDAFPGEVFAEDDERPVEELVLELARARRLTLATAESSTGGLVAARLTDVPGSSDVFLGGVVAYSNEVKVRELGVPESLLREHGAVSAEAAAAMAAGARRRLGADVAVAVTGIAGPGGGTAAKPVGLVYVAAESPDADSLASVQIPGDREAVRERATALALHALRRLLSHNATHAGE
jgi:nicotinamide-nucleotide amidase